MNSKTRTQERFSRIKVDNLTYLDDRVKDNTFEGKVCARYFMTLLRSNTSPQPRPMNDYGQKAHEDLIVTRGAGFRKEKNKKKRGSYRGGEITVCPQPTYLAAETVDTVTDAEP